MKRLILSLPVLFFSFGCGIVAAAFFQTFESKSPEAAETRYRYEPVSYPIETTKAENANPEIIAARGDGNPDIVEFSDLPNFEDLPLEDTEPDGKLIDVLESGARYRKSEVIARNGETWLTLFERKGKYEFVDAKTSVKQLRTSSYTGEENDAALSFDKPGTPVFAVKNIRRLKSGKITSLYHHPSWEEISRRNLDIKSMEDGYKKEFDLNDSWYTLRVANGRTKDGTNAAILVLEHKGTYQILRQVYRGLHEEKPIIGSLLWAGDLDRDGKLDLYFDEFNEKGYTRIDLYLSTHAKPNNLLGLAASFGMAGC